MFSHSGEIPVCIYHITYHFCVSRLRNAKKENWRRPRLNTTTSLCSWVEGVFSFILCGGWLSHAGLSLMGVMHYSFHSWRYTTVLCAETERKELRRRKSGLVLSCFLNTVSSVDLLHLCPQTTLRNRSFPAISVETIHLYTSKSSWSCLCVCFQKADCLLSHWLLYPMSIWESKLLYD